MEFARFELKYTYSYLHESNHQYSTSVVYINSDERKIYILIMVNTDTIYRTFPKYLDRHPQQIVQI